MSDLIRYHLSQRNSMMDPRAAQPAPEQRSIAGEMLGARRDGMGLDEDEMMRRYSDGLESLKQSYKRPQEPRRGMLMADPMTQLGLRGMSGGMR